MIDPWIENRVGPAPSRQLTIYGADGGWSRKLARLQTRVAGVRGFRKHPQTRRFLQTLVYSVSCHLPTLLVWRRQRQLMLL
jgi:hypothetical protein